MRERETIQQLIDDDTVATTLRRRSGARHAITALQTLLHWLGFDQQLQWDRFGADGGYGAATVAAVGEFARRNGSRANGERVTGPLAASILARYLSVEALKQVADDVAGNRVERVYKPGGERLKIAALQSLLNDLGYGAELNWARFGADGGYGRSTRKAVAAFAAKEGLDGDGSVLTQQLGQRIVAKLGPFYGDNWHDLSHSAAPAPGSLTIRSVLGSRGQQLFEVTDGVFTKKFQPLREGLSTFGDQKPAAFVESHPEELRKLGITPSEINVILSVSENEGKLDAINTYDNAFLSFGFFQWTAGTDSARGELPALLARIKHEDPDLFVKYCGQHGLDVDDVVPTNWQTAATGPQYGRFSFGGRLIRTAADKAPLRTAPWAFYFWRAGQDPAVQAMEFKHALARLEWFYDTDDYTADGHRISQLVTSEYGVALLLDNHVNRPAHVRKILAEALARTGLPDPKSWGTEEERKLIAAYLDIRVTYGRPAMTDAPERAKRTKSYLTKGLISDGRDSFKRSRR